ncbi:hypothetical protein CLV93_1072 [Prolixibacter denitrificans]|uniref:Uncharacterized protein n=1 Tax=Prolixibacter denitrificans TaxID=1541063 RepID=A0A2P8CAA0_9BACT|nr:hypothetical protein CLV93_1072 [Prolixibacter denitrificans]
MTLILLIGSFKAIACDCGYLGGFVYSNQAADIVVYGTVLEYDSIGTHDSPDNPYSMKFLIKEKLRGIENRDTIIVWGDNGADCRPYIEHFKPNTNWILALNKLNKEGKVEYEISICGEFYVPVENGKVTGKIFGWNYEQEKKKYDYQYIKNLVLNPLDYPAQRPEKNLRKTKDGLEYMSNCDRLPQNTLDFKTLNKIVNENLVIPPTFMSCGDSYLIHIKAIIDKNGEFHANGAYGSNKTNELIAIENQISKILRDTGTWKVGYEANKPVASELIIPILLKK